jgi:hypothetical protein
MLVRSMTWATIPLSRLARLLAVHRSTVGAMTVAVVALASTPAAAANLDPWSTHALGSVVVDICGDGNVTGSEQCDPALPSVTSTCNCCTNTPPHGAFGACSNCHTHTGPSSGQGSCARVSQAGPDPCSCQLLTTTTSSTITTTTTTSTVTTSTIGDVLIPGRIGRVATLKSGGILVKVSAKPLAGDTFPLPSGNPLLVGGSLRVFDTAATAGDNTYDLPAPLGWKGLGKPPGSVGYKYQGAGTAGDPCKVVLVKNKLIKAVCRGVGVTLTPPFTGDVGVVLSVGTTDRYCARFGGDEVTNTAEGTKRRNAPAPPACP